MPSLVATTSTPARKPFVRTHYVRTNNAKFSALARTTGVRTHFVRTNIQEQYTENGKNKTWKYLLPILINSQLILTKSIGVYHMCNNLTKQFNHWMKVF